MKNNKRKIPGMIYILVLFILWVILSLMWYGKPVTISYLLGVDLTIFNWINTAMSNEVFDSIMPWITYLGHFWAGWIFIIILIMINGKPMVRSLRLGLFASFIYGCVSGVYYLIRYLVNRPRPFIDHEVIVRVAYPPADPSFPSGTAAIIFMMATILSFQLPKYRYVFYGLACLVGFSRVYLGVHYPSDVIVGALIGYGVTKILVSNKFLRAHIMEKSWESKNNSVCGRLENEKKSK